MYRACLNRQLAFCRLLELGSKLGQLEAQKADAIGREDYDAAKSIKQQIMRMRAGGTQQPTPADAPRSSADVGRRRAAPEQPAVSSGPQSSSSIGDGGDAVAESPAQSRGAPPALVSQHDEQVCHPWYSGHILPFFYSNSCCRDGLFKVYARCSTHYNHRSMVCSRRRFCRPSFSVFCRL